VDGTVLVDVGQQRPHPLRAGLETLPTQERVEPDQPPARAVEAVGLGGEPRLGVAVEAVGDQQHRGAVAEDPARPRAVEIV